MAIEILDPGTDERRLNLDKLAKGDYLSIPIIRDATGLDPGENYERYMFYLLNLRKTLSKKHHLISKCINYGLYILTDHEASEYKAKQSKRRRRGAHRDYVDLGKVDERNLSPAQLQEHRQRVKESSLYLAATQRVRQVIRTEKRTAMVNQQLDTMKKLQKPVIVISTKGVDKGNGVSGSESGTDGNS